MMVHLRIVMVVVFLAASAAWAQHATVRGLVKDSTGAVVPEAAVAIENVGTAGTLKTITNKEGLYLFGSLLPATYKVTVTHAGFKPVTTPEFQLRSGDIVPVDITLNLGSASASVTVTDEPPIVQAESGTVRTVISGALANQLPLNGQTLQPLLSLVPGVAFVPGPNNVGGDFSINGQRTTSNYYQVDGFSANLGTYSARSISTTLGGSLPTLSALGTTSGMASFDSVSEIEIQTSSFAAEFGRTPGGQISLVTKSGTNQFHGSAYEYLRNEAFNSNDWFANSAGLSRARSRQKTTGGTFGGPVDLWRQKNLHRIFFFAAYENSDLSLPVSRTFGVPTLAFRQQVAPVLQPVLRSYPQPNGPILDAFTAQYVAAYANSANGQTLSFRTDYSLSDRTKVYFRYLRAPSAANSRDNSNPATHDLNNLSTYSISGSVTSTLNAHSVIEVGINLTQNQASSSIVQGTLNNSKPYEIGAIVPSLADITSAGAQTVSFTLPDNFAAVSATNPVNSQRQLEVAPHWTQVFGRHTVKLGSDWRRLTPTNNLTPVLILFIRSLNSALAGFADSLSIANGQNISAAFTQVSSFAQDEWRAGRLTLTFGLRWEVNPPPGVRNGQRPVTLTDFNNFTTSTLQFTDSLYRTRYHYVAPRLGMAWRPATGFHAPVFRAGGGVFYDTGVASIGNAFTGFPYAYSTQFTNVALPASVASVPAFGIKLLQPPFPASTVIDPDFTSPRSFQWNAAVEAPLSRAETISATYTGSRGLDLSGLQRYAQPSLGAAFASTASLSIVQSHASSSYHSLQLHYERRLYRNVQALAGYTWQHSIDTVSNDSTNTLEKGSSSFDIRQTANFSVAASVPHSAQGGWARRIYGGWTLFVIDRYQTAPPIDITVSGDVVDASGTDKIRRPNWVYGQPFWTNDPHSPGGRLLNKAAFQTAPGGIQGNLGRDVVRGFGLSQLDAAISREVSPWERVHVSLRADAFNLLNHPNFAQPIGSLTSPLFGPSRSLLSGLLGISGVALNQQFQTGGPRSLQLSLRVSF